MTQDNHGKAEDDPKLVNRPSFYGNREYENESIPGREIPNDLPRGHTSPSDYNDDGHATDGYTGEASPEEESFERPQSYYTHDDLGPTNLRRDGGVRQGSDKGHNPHAESGWTEEERREKSEGGD